MRWGFWWLGLLGLPLVLGVGALMLNGAGLVDPPGVGERLRVYLTRNLVLTAPDHPFPELRSRCYQGTVEELGRQLEQAMRVLGWELPAVGQRPLSRQALITSHLWRFRDDLAVELQPEADGRICLHIRSESRVGKGDFGANRRHVLDLYRELGRIRGEADR